MKRSVIILLLFCVFTLNAQTISKKNRDAIMAMLAFQEKCWNAGSIEGYMSEYWNSDSLKFISKDGVTKGWQTTLDRYEEHYPGKDAMGKLIFSEISLLGMNRKTIIVIGKWKLIKPDGSAGGRFTLICKKIRSKWKIVVDHTS